MPAAELDEVRRVVTGQTPDGRSTVLFDGPPTLIGPPAQLWTTTGAPVDNTGTGDAAICPITLVAPERGSRFWYVRMAPGHGMDTERHGASSARLRELGAQVRMDVRPDMHSTRTLDYVIVLQGQITLVLEDGEVTLDQFDCVVQRGTAHTWENRTDAPALLAFVLLDAAEV